MKSLPVKLEQAQGILARQPFLRALTIRASDEEVIARLKFLLGIAFKRMRKMPLWLVDDFTKILVGAARGPLLDFEIRCRMKLEVFALNREVQKGRAIFITGEEKHGGQ